jgi:hypothetical protein
MSEKEEWVKDEAWERRVSETAAKFMRHPGIDAVIFGVLTDGAGVIYVICPDELREAAVIALRSQADRIEEEMRAESNGSG